jgi:hypothetical protein
MILLLLIVVLLAVGFGLWRGFGSIQWIWLFFGLAITMVVLWVIALVFVIGPEMRRIGPPGR